MANKLKSEKSPYLLDHADDPVLWLAWGEEAFDLAKEQDKPVFLSIGYSACHWCHVMHKESFQDQEVAILLNEHFICVKVDREERPDVDSQYMTVCQLMTGSGGWPLSIFLTPDKHPFFAATYIPKIGGVRTKGMLDVLPAIVQVWKNRKQDALAAGLSVAEQLKAFAVRNADPGFVPDESVLHETFEQLRTRFDNTNAGFGAAPKFPMPHVLVFLCRYYNRYRDEKALDMVKKTLSAMYFGGIRDHAGRGYHRYSTDERWHLPHFEKMLYDQAMISLAAEECFQACKEEFFRDQYLETLSFMFRRLYDHEGKMFFSAEDADTGGKEGAYYVWTEDELKRILSPGDFAIFVRAYGISASGNFKDEATGEFTGENVLSLAVPVSVLAEELSLDPAELNRRIFDMLAALLLERDKREKPRLDTKGLVDWNGLALASVCKGGRIEGSCRGVGDMIETAYFILENMRDETGRLLHRFKDNEAAHPAVLDDYAFFLVGLVELIQADASGDWIARATELAEIMIRDFYDQDGGGFFYTAENQDPILARQKEYFDGSLPSGSGVAMEALIRLGLITGRQDYLDKAMTVAQVAACELNTAPSAHCQLATALDLLIGPSYKVEVSGDFEFESTKEFYQKLNRAYLPRCVIVPRDVKNADPEIRICGMDSCLESMDDVDEAIEYLSRPPSSATV